MARNVDEEAREGMLRHTSSTQLFQLTLPIHLFSMTATSDLAAVIFLMPSGLVAGRYAASQLQQQSQHRGGGGEGLHEENALVDRHAAEESGNHDAAEEKHGNFGAVVAEQQRPQQAGGQKPVVQPLVPRQ